MSIRRNWISSVVCCLLLLRSAAGQCTIAFDILESNSTLAFSGGVVKPLSTPITLTEPAPSLGLSGRLYLSLINATICPGNFDSIISAIASQGASLVFPEDASALSLYPPFVKAQAGGLATLTVRDLGLQLSSTVLQGSNGDLFSAEVEGLVTRGSVAALTSFSPKTTTVSLAGLKTTSQQDVDLDGEGTLATLHIEDLKLAFTSDFSSGGVQGSVAYMLRGDVVAQAELGCSKPCGVHGKCVSEEGGIFSCVCECGWAGEQCDQAGGFCSAFGASSACSSLAILGISKSASAPSPSSYNVTRTPLSQSTSGPCPDSRQVRSPMTGACDACAAGWEGPACAVCGTDAACRTFTRDSRSSCSHSLAYDSRSQLKAYECDTAGTAFGNYVQPGSFYFACNTTGRAGGALDQITTGPGSAIVPGATPGIGNGSQAGPQGAPGPFCEVHFALRGGQGAATCYTTGCQFAVNKTEVRCNATRCICADCSSSVQGLLDQVQGRPARFSCDEASSRCTLDITNFLAPLTAPCRAGDCISAAGEATVIQKTLPDAQRSYAPLIASLPLLALLGLALVAGLYLSTSLRLVAAALPSAVGGATYGLGGGPKGGVQRHACAFTTLRFENLICSVPYTRRGGRTTPGGLSAPALQALAKKLSAGQAVWAPKRSDAIEDDEASNGLVESMENGMENGGHAAVGTPLKAEMEMQSMGGSGGAEKGQSGATTQKTSQMSRLAEMPAVHRGKRRLLILRGVSGQASVGELVGVLGPSGCGKTTLLGILAGSATELGRGSAVTGSILLDGRPMPLAAQARLVAHVPQADGLLATLTVAECLRYSALLRLPESTPMDAVQARVEGVLDELGLRQVAGSQVGGAAGIRGISGGELRRVSIGMELVIDPAALVLDEPTSGLDSFIALNLLSTLKQVARRGRIVLLSFHQPSPAMFDILDSAVLMAAGRCVFAGPPASAPAWFAAAGLPVPDSVAVAEHLLQCVSEPKSLSRLFEALDSGRVPDSSTTAEGSGMSARAAEEWTLLRSASLPSPDVPLQAADPLHASSGRQQASFRRQLSVLTWRTAVDIWRNRMLLLLHVATALAMGTLCGLIFFRAKNDLPGAQNRAGGIFFSLCFFAFASTTTADLLMAERRLVAREARSGYYSPAAYMLAKLTLDGLLLRALPALCYAAPFYALMGLQAGAARVLLFCTTLASFSATVGALSMAVTAGSSSAGRASLVMNMLLLFSLLLGGFLVNLASIPRWLRWLHAISPFYYAFCALLVNEVAGLLLDIKVNGFAALRNLKGEVFLDALGIAPDKLAENVAALCAMYAGFVLLSFALLYLTLPRPTKVLPTEDSSADRA